MFFVGGRTKEYHDIFSALEHDHLLDKIVQVRGAPRAPYEPGLPLQSLHIDDMFRDRDDEQSSTVFSPGSDGRSKSLVSRSQTPSIASYLLDESPLRPTNETSSSTAEGIEHRKLRPINPDLVRPSLYNLTMFLIHVKDLNKSCAFPNDIY